MQPRCAGGAARRPPPGGAPKPRRRVRGARALPGAHSERAQRSRLPRPGRLARRRPRGAAAAGYRVRARRPAAPRSGATRRRSPVDDGLCQGQRRRWPPTARSSATRRACGCPAAARAFRQHHAPRHDRGRPGALRGVAAGGRWKSAGLVSDAFTAALFYYQFVPILLSSAPAVGLSLVARRRVVAARRALPVLLGRLCDVLPALHRRRRLRRPPLLFAQVVHRDAAWKLFLATSRCSSARACSTGPACASTTGCASTTSTTTRSTWTSPRTSPGRSAYAASSTRRPCGHHAAPARAAQQALERYLTPDIVRHPDLQWYNAFVDESPLLSRASAAGSCRASPSRPRTCSGCTAARTGGDAPPPLRRQ